MPTRRLFLACTAAMSAAPWTEERLFSALMYPAIFKSVSGREPAIDDWLLFRGDGHAQPFSLSSMQPIGVA